MNSCRWFRGAVSALVLLPWVTVMVSAAAPSGERLYTFDGDATDKPPPGFFEALTGEGQPGCWHVVEASDAPSGRQVVAQRSDDTTSALSAAAARGFCSTERRRVRAIPCRCRDGRPGGGNRRRWQDKNNYYVVRANALEHNVVAYKTVAGKRSSIGVAGDKEAYGIKVEVPPQKWHTLRVHMVGQVAEVYFNDQRLFVVDNDAITSAGKVGLWTKADSVTQFDDLRVQSLDDP